MLGADRILGFEESIMACLLEARIVKPAQIACARERL
jgi:hypothetical protein